MAEDRIARRHPGWWLLGVVVPCLITSFFSYRTAKVQADEKASAGYAALVEGQKELQQAFKEHLAADGRITAEHGAKIDLIEKMVMRLYSVERSAPTSTARHAALVRPLPPPAAPEPHFETFKATALPETLDAAMKQQAAKR